MKQSGNHQEIHRSAFILGPLSVLPASIPLVLFFLATGEPLIEGIGGKIASGLFVGFLGLLVAYPLTLCYGMPVWLALNKLNKLTLRNILIASTGPAILIGIYVQEISSALFYSYFSVIVAGSCWIINNRKQRNSNQPNQQQDSHAGSSA